MRRSLPIFALAALSMLAAPSSRGEPSWDVTNTGQPFSDIRFTTTEGTWMSLDVSPDGRSIVFDLLGDIYTVPMNGGEARLVHGGPALQRTPSFSADGKKLLYVSDASGMENAWVSNVDGSDAHQVTHETSRLVMAAAWGGDDRSVAAAVIDGSYPRRFASEIRLFDIRGGSRVIVPTPQNRRDVAEPSFSRDGRYVYYTERLAPSFVIYVDANHINYAIKRRDLRTGVIESIASGWGGALSPQVSPNGARLAFVKRVKEKTVLFDLDLARSEQRAVYDGLDRDLQASYEAQVNYYPHFGWFPDGRHVAIWGKGRILKVDMDTGQAQEIPFRVEAEHRITEPLRVKHDLAPQRLKVRAVRHLAPSPDGKIMVFTALGHLWRKAIPAGAPRRLTEATAFEFEPAYSEDGRQIAYAQWDDESGGALRVASSEGRGARSLVESGGVIREPHFSKDGRRITYRIQSPDVSMGGARARPGVYWIDLRGGQPRRVADSGELPQFAPDGLRIYFVDRDSSGESPAEVLRSVTLDGLDRRDHARAPDADTSEMRVSPDLRWIGFKERQQYYVAPYRETGTPLMLSAASGEAPVRKLSVYGGYALTWDARSAGLYWALGSQLHRTVMMDEPAEAAEHPFADVDLEVAADEPKGTIVFSNARLITLRGEGNAEVLERGSVVVRGNRIVEVGDADSVAIPPGARVIDATGKTIMPGLVDGHGHIDCCWGTGAAPQKEPSLHAALAFGVTTNFDPYPNELTSYERTELEIAGLAVGPRWIGTGMAVWGRSQQSSHGYVPIASYDDARNVIARKQALGGYVVKSYRYPGRAQRQMLLKAGRAAGVMVDVEGESQFYNNLTMILDGHMNLEHNLPVANYYDDIVQFMGLAHAHNTPTLVVNFGELFGENYMYQTTEAWKDPKIVRYVQEALTGYSPLQAPYGGPPYVRAMTTIHAAPEIYEIGFRSVARATKRLDDAGVTINVGSHGEVPGLAMHWEMALLAEGGMSNLRILRAATLNTARTLGIDEQVGSLEPGKLADLIVLDRDPLTDIHNTNSVRYTMVNGRLYDALSLDELGQKPRSRTRFYWEMEKGRTDWNPAWSMQ